MNRKLILIALLVLICSACRERRDDVVARVFDEYLYRSDIEGLVAEGTSPEDSAVIVGNYVNQWIQQMVVLEKAKRNVKENFDKELLSYKNSLITYAYECNIVDQMLDTNISEQEIADYYQANGANFILHTTIVRVLYAKMLKDAKEANQIKNLMARSNLSDETLSELQRLAVATGADYSLDESVWMPFQRFQSIIPIESWNESSFAREHTNIAFADDHYVYVARILESKSVNEQAPLEFERDNIRTILLNKRKIDVIKNMQRDLLKDAESKGKIEIY